MNPEPNPHDLVPSPVRPLAPGEALAGTDASVGDFWTWAFSDLRDNTVRATLAEYLVLLAVGAEASVRTGWDNFDVLAPDGTRIEVKAAGYLQSWSQKEVSVPHFSRLAAREFDASTNEYSEGPMVRADVFVFAIQTQSKPESYDPLDVDHWEFYVVHADRIRELGTKSVGLGWVKANCAGPVKFGMLNAEISGAAKSGTKTTQYRMPRALRDAVESTLPPHAHENVALDELFKSISETPNGHATQAGWHFGWTWSDDGSSLAFLSEHRMTDIAANTFVIDAAEDRITMDPIATPTGMHLSSEDPDEAAKLAAEHTAESRRLYDNLRSRGLLPALGENVASQDINELLITDRLEPDSDD